MAVKVTFEADSPSELRFAMLNVAGDLDHGVPAAKFEATDEPSQTDYMKGSIDGLARRVAALEDFRCEISDHKCEPFEFYDGITGHLLEADVRLPRDIYKDKPERKVHLIFDVCKHCGKVMQTIEEIADGQDTEPVG